MLFKVIIHCFAIGVPKAEPLRMEPQFEASDEDEVRKELLPKWLEDTRYEQAEGTDVEIVEVEPTVEPEPEPEPESEPVDKKPVTASGPMGADGVRLPTLEEYVAADYPAERYDAFIAARTKQPDPAAKVEAQPPVLVAGESTREDGAVYMGHDANGQEVWDPPSPSSEDAKKIGEAAAAGAQAGSERATRDGETEA